MYDVIRGLHILAVIAWMAGLLYLPRLFIYHIKHKESLAITDVFKVMERNLLRIIMNPAMIAAWIFGCVLIYINIQGWGWRFLWQPWFIVKIIGIVGLTLYHHFLALRYKKLMRDESIGSESLWRKLNEIPFVLAILMVLAVTTQFLSV